MKITHLLFLTACMTIASLHSIAQRKPIKLHPKNPHYFLYKKKPAILITSGEHYGAVLNLDFDYTVYLDELKSKGLNMTRVFTGAYVEPQGAFNIESNTLAPKPNKFIAPWARSTQPGYTGGGNKFDLTKWDDAYISRLKAFLKAASDRRIIVEFALFCPFYEEVQWKLSPMNASNNVNGIGSVAKDNVYTIDKNEGLLAIHDALVQKLVRELNQYDNIMFEICNEPYFGGVSMEWQHHIASLIELTEKPLKKKHLITQNIANDKALITNPHPGVSVFNFHYATPPVAVTQNFHLNKVIGDNETGFKGQADSTYRKEGWEIILAGGALYNNLDYSFAVAHEKGTYVYPEKQPGGGTVALRQQLGYLRTFINTFNYIAMRPDTEFIADGLSGARAHVLSEAGKQYAAYILHGNQLNLSVTLPAGDYAIEWMDPVSGNYVKKESIQHAGGKAKITTPSYSFDIALSIRAK